METDARGKSHYEAIRQAQPQLIGSVWVINWGQS